MAASNSGGVTPVSIAGRVARERERLIGMTPEERAWRAKYLKSQILADDEPIIPKGYDKERYNPIRRFYMAPLNIVEKSLVPLVGGTAATVIRRLIGKSVLGIFAIYGSWYYFKYNTGTWMRMSGWRVMKSRETVFPGSSNYPNFESPRKPNEYATFGFEKSPI